MIVKIMEKNELICFIFLWIVSACSAALSCDMQIPHGDVDGWCDTSPCPYTCHEGYKEHDTVSWLTCSTSGLWVSWPRNRPVSAKDLCTPKPCPTVIPKGVFSGACQAVVGSTCSFSCEAGYIRNMSVSELTCQTSTEWSPDLRSLCLRPDGQQCTYYIPRGYLNLTCIREPGQTCNFTCDEVYQPSISPSTIICGSNLQWNHNPESLCQETICPKLFEGGYVSKSCSRKYKATCYDFKCNPGYIKRTLPYPVTCDESGKWINPYDTSPVCVNIYNTSSSRSFRTTSPAVTTYTSLFPKLSCDMQIPHGDVDRWCDTRSCPYSCHEGYKEHDTVSWLTCSTSGQLVSWPRNRPVSAKDLCTPKPCPTLIPKGVFSGACQAVVGSTCSFSCEAGYMRNISVSELTCQTSTEWSPDLKSLCLRPDGQQCPYYILRGYLNHTCIGEPGQTCNFTCDEGYQPSISPSTIVCGSDLRWNHNQESLCQGTSKSYFNDGRSGNGNLGTIVGTTVGALAGILIIFSFIGWIVKRSVVRKSQRETGGVGSGCLRPRENPLQDITTIRQQPNTNGMGSVSSFGSPSYNGIYVHPYLQTIPAISSSCNYSDPPPSYSKTPNPPNKAPPTYEEVVSDHSRFNLYN